MTQVYTESSLFLVLVGLVVLFLLTEAVMWIVARVRKWRLARSQEYLRIPAKKADPNYTSKQFYVPAAMRDHKHPRS